MKLFDTKEQTKYLKFLNSQAKLFCSFFTRISSSRRQTTATTTTTTIAREWQPFWKIIFASITQLSGILVAPFAWKNSSTSTFPETGARCCYCCRYRCALFAIHCRLRSLSLYQVISLFYAVFICQTYELNSLVAAAVNEFKISSSSLTHSLTHSLT